jgi:predicted nucleic acid-binding protein
VKFVDTSWWVAWALPRDRHHDDALAMPTHLGSTEQLLTTNLIVGESWTFLRRKDSHRIALEFLDRVDVLTTDHRVVVHRVTDEQEEAAWQWLRQHDERAYSFVDATSFRVMRDRRLREAFAFDHDFAAAGFVEVTPERSRPNQPASSRPRGGCR